MHVIKVCVSLDEYIYLSESKLNWRPLCNVNWKIISIFTFLSVLDKLNDCELTRIIFHQTDAIFDFIFAIEFRHHQNTLLLMQWTRWFRYYCTIQHTHKHAQFFLSYKHWSQIISNWILIRLSILFNTFSS